MKRTLKVFIAFILVISVLCGCCISAFANQTQVENVDSAVSKDVIFEYVVSSISPDVVYSVDVMWDDISFEYGGSGNRWNPGTHSFDIANGDSSLWSDGKGSVTVTNHSNAAVVADFSFKQAVPANGTAYINLENASFTLESADGNSDSASLTNSCTMIAEGVVENSGSIGRIILSLSSTSHKHVWNNGVCVECNQTCKHYCSDGICDYCGYNSLYEREGDVIYFGQYPQTLKADSVTILDEPAPDGYVMGSDNCYYVKATATPYESGYKFSTNATVTSGTTYYFKVELIKWRIVEESNGMATLICESILDSHCYDDDNNNYELSQIREWLNSTFYEKAFKVEQRNVMQTVTIDNSAASTGYSGNANACKNTSDKVFLLSYADVTNGNYGFASDDDRTRVTTDFARANGAWMSTNIKGGYYGNGIWMLRSPNDTYTHFIRECNYNGEITDGGTNLTNKFYGVVPMIKIKL